MTVGWGILGTGRHADVAVAPAIVAAPDAALAAVVSRGADRARTFATRHGAASYGTDYAAMLRDTRVDVVYVSSPNAEHEEATIAALKAGKHVLSEKPLALSAEGATRVGRIAHHTGLKVGVFFQLRHHPGHQKIRDLIHAGAIGEVLVVEAHAGSYGEASGWRTNPALAGGGVIFDQGVHLYDLVRYVTGAEVVAVSVLDDRPAGEWLDRTTMCMLKMSNQALAYACCDHRLAVPNRSLEVRGSSGSLIFSEGTDLSSRKPLRSTLSIASADGVFEETFELCDLIDRQIGNFNRAIIEGHEPDASWSDGLRNAEIVGAIQRAAATGTLALVEHDAAADDSRFKRR